MPLCFVKPSETMLCRKNLRPRLGLKFGRVRTWQTIGMAKLTPIASGTPRSQKACHQRSPSWQYRGLAPVPRMLNEEGAAPLSLSIPGLASWLAGRHWGSYRKKHASRQNHIFISSVPGSGSAHIHTCTATTTHTHTHTPPMHTYLHTH